MQVIDPNKPFFVDSLPNPSRYIRPMGRNTDDLSDGKNVFTIKVNIAPLPFPNPMNETIRLFNQEEYTAYQSWYDTNVVVNGGNQTYAYIMNQVINNAYRVSWVKIVWRFTSLSIDPQLQEPLNYIYLDANGLRKEDRILGIDDIDIYQRVLSTIEIDLRDTPLLFDGITYLEYKIVQDPTPIGINMTFYYDKILKSDVVDEVDDITRLLTDIK